MKIALFLGLLALSIVFTPVYASHYVTTYGDYWDHAPVICFDFGPDSIRYQYAMLAGALDWKNKFREHYGTNAFDFTITKRVDQNCDVVVYFEDSMRPDMNNDTALGLTMCYFANGSMYSCEVEIFISRTQEPLLRGTSTHELGHVWGMEHMKVKDMNHMPWLVMQGDIMMPNANKFQKITKHTMEVFEAIYGKNGWNSRSNLEIYTIRDHQ